MKECPSTFFIEKTLSYIELYVGNATRDKIYNAMALDLCSSLLDAALTLTEDALTENLVIRVVNIAKCISTFAVKQTSIEAVCLQHSVVAFVCNVGTRFYAGVSDKVIQVRLFCFVFFPFLFQFSHHDTTPFNHTVTSRIYFLHSSKVELVSYFAESFVFGMLH